MPVTILDIAKKAGVSKSTVSLVINGSDSVKMETRYKVQQAIDELGYVPNQAARQLTTSFSRTLGLIFLTSNHFARGSEFSAVPETLLYDAMTGVNTALRDTDYTLLIERFSSAGGDVVPYLVKSRRLDGVILIGGLFGEGLMEQIGKLKIPVVIIGRQYQSFDSVSVDLEQAGYLGVDYLLRRGHRSILFINGPEGSSNSRTKLAGVKRALAEHRLPESAVRTVYAGYAGMSGYRCFLAAWEAGARPDAVFGGSDGITLGAMRFLYERGLRVPDDISVVGYEDTLLSRYASPAVTCVDVQRETLGVEACKILMNRIKKPRAQQTALRIPPSLVERSSVRSR